MILPLVCMPSVRPSSSACLFEETPHHSSSVSILILSLAPRGPAVAAWPRGRCRVPWHFNSDNARRDARTYALDLQAAALLRRFVHFVSLRPGLMPRQQYHHHQEPTARRSMHTPVPSTQMSSNSTAARPSIRLIIVPNVLTLAVDLTNQAPASMVG